MWAQITEQKEQYNDVKNLSTKQKKVLFLVYITRIPRELSHLLTSLVFSSLSAPETLLYLKFTHNIISSKQCSKNGSSSLQDVWPPPWTLVPRHWLCSLRISISPERRSRAGIYSLTRSKLIVELNRDHTVVVWCRRIVWTQTCIACEEPCKKWEVEGVWWDNIKLWSLSSIEQKKRYLIKPFDQRDLQS